MKAHPRTAAPAVTAVSGSSAVDLRSYRLGVASVWERLEGLRAELIEALDALGIDCDFEETGDDESSLGSLGAHHQLDWAARHSDTDDLEAQCEDEGADSGDDEPWLGRSETGFGASQGFGGGGNGVLDGEVLLSPVEGD